MLKLSTVKILILSRYRYRRVTFFEIEKENKFIMVKFDKMGSI
jgi:hypothetical protein